jgi:hypothetical protein
MNRHTIKLLEHKFKDKQAFRKMTNDFMEYKPKTTIHQVPNIIKSTKSELKEEPSDFKDSKPIDELGVEWKEGKMAPATKNTIEAPTKTKIREEPFFFETESIPF